ncbi:hypothetical protein ACFY7C_07690 [Streptomyces sp. NPDC012769]|uniref:hypothetical protein n=1 Tax=Streptomyces sp. NPDC012769 TaxID=3364848 RepID=UPI0036807344
MIRHTMRALCAASLVIAPLALAAAPAHAATCTVNGVSRTGAAVTGTAGPDYIVCSGVVSGDTVNGLGGDDYIHIEGQVAGTVLGGDGRDYISAPDGVAGGMTSTGRVLGEAGNDYIRTGPNAGVVNGGTGFDYCRVTSGNPPVSCEF